MLPFKKDLFDMPNKAGQTALLVASKENNFDVVIRLVKAGASADTGDEMGSPIQYTWQQFAIG